MEFQLDKKAQQQRPIMKCTKYLLITNLKILCFIDRLLLNYKDKKFMPSKIIIEDMYNE